MTSCTTDASPFDNVCEISNSNSQSDNESSDHEAENASMMEEKINEIDLFASEPDEPDEPEHPSKSLPDDEVGDADSNVFNEDPTAEQCKNDLNLNNLDKSSFDNVSESKTPEAVLDEHDNFYNNVEHVLPRSYTYNSASSLVIPKLPIRLLVQCIPKSMGVNELKSIFEEYGPVEEAVILKDRAVNDQKGSAFVKMKSLTSADNAIAAMSGIKVLDESLGPIQIRYAVAELEKLGVSVENAVPGVNQTRLFIGSLSRQADEEQIMGLFSTVCPVEDVYVIREAGTGASRGCAFVVLATKEAAIYAIKCLNGSEQLSALRPLEIRFADVKSKSAQNQAGFNQGEPYNNNNNRVNFFYNNAPPQDYTNYPQSNNFNYSHPQMRHENFGAILVSSADVNAQPRERDGWFEYFTEEGRPFYQNSTLNVSQWEKPLNFDTPGPPGANLFVFHVPSEWSLRELVYYFRKYGTIISATIATDRSTGRNRGYAFVSYTDIQSAVNAVKAMHGFSTGSKRLKVAIKQNEESYVAHLLKNSGSGSGSNFSYHPPNINGPGYCPPMRSYAAPY
uniref:RNA-binding protein BRN1-like n=1 Tax=Dermatophagoides pteronyssinus TaxID=6956 RepID=A0A6P6XLI0_DERPT|nr:RNA-binding protein BRN1-like [Dermatophagoides pteronyssinus]